MPDPRVIDPTRPEGEGTHYPDGAPAPIPLGEWQEYAEQVAKDLAVLARNIRAPKRLIPVAGVAAGNTDDDGFVTFPVYQCGEGFYFHLERLNVEAATFDTTTPRTPASPFTAADFWAGFFISTDPRSVAQGQMFDFIPTTAAAQGLPAVAEYQEHTGPLARSGEFIVCYMEEGPSNQRITVRYQGSLEGVES